MFGLNTFLAAFAEERCFKQSMQVPSPAQCSTWIIRKAFGVDMPCYM